MATDGAPNSDKLVGTDVNDITTATRVMMSLTASLERASFMAETATIPFASAA